MSNVVGEHNVDFWFIPAAHGSPLKIFVAVGSATPPTVYEHTAGYYGYDEMRGFLRQDARVAGLGEVMDWTSVWDPEAPGYQRLWEVMQATSDARGVLEGHGMGLDDSDRVSAYAAAGLSSDHHIKTGEEGILKLRSGVFIELAPAYAIDGDSLFVGGMTSRIGLTSQYAPMIATPSRLYGTGRWIIISEPRLRWAPRWKWPTPWQPTTRPGTGISNTRSAPLRLAAMRTSC